MIKKETSDQRLSKVKISNLINFHHSAAIPAKGF